MDVLLSPLSHLDHFLIALLGYDVAAKKIYVCYMKNLTATSSERASEDTIFGI